MHPADLSSDRKISGSNLRLRLQGLPRSCFVGRIGAIRDSRIATTSTLQTAATDPIPPHRVANIASAVIDRRYRTNPDAWHARIGFYSHRRALQVRPVLEPTSVATVAILYVIHV